MLKVAARMPPGAGWIALVLAARIAAVRARHGSRRRHDWRHNKQREGRWKTPKINNQINNAPRLAAVKLDGSSDENAYRLGGGVDSDWWSTFVPALYLPVATRRHYLPQSLSRFLEWLKESSSIAENRSMSLDNAHWTPYSSRHVFFLKRQQHPAETQFHRMPKEFKEACETDECRSSSLQRLLAEPAKNLSINQWRIPIESFDILETEVNLNWTRSNWTLLFICHISWNSSAGWNHHTKIAISDCSWLIGRW